MVRNRDLTGCSLVLADTEHLRECLVAAALDGGTVVVDGKDLVLSAVDDNGLACALRLRAPVDPVLDDVVLADLVAGSAVAEPAVYAQTGITPLACGIVGSVVQCDIVVFRCFLGNVKGHATAGKKVALVY